MKKDIVIEFIYIGMLCLLFALPASANEEILIGTADRDGVYYYAGRAISRIVNTKAEGFECKVLPTAGSFYNLSNVNSGALDLGIAQSDLQYHFVNGSGPAKYMDGSFENLRALFSLHAESFTLVVRLDSDIDSFDDIAGRRVNIGNPGSGQRSTMEVVMNAMGWTKSTFKLAEELNASEQSFALCNRRIEAMVYTVGHPNESVAKAVKLCNASLVEVSGPVIDKLIGTTPYYSRTLIPAGIYAGVSKPVVTFGVKSTVVASSNLSPDTVYDIVKAIFDNIESFRKLHPALNMLDPREMVRDGLSAELHEGAKKYYQEKGLL